MMLQKMADAMRAKNDTSKLGELINKMMTEAENIYEMSADGKKDGIVVYINLSSYIFRLLDDMGKKIEAFTFGSLALERSMAMLGKLEKVSPEALTYEMKCNYKTIQLMQLVIINFELQKEPEYKESLSNDNICLSVALYQLYVKCYEELKMLVPTSPLVLNSAAVYEMIMDMRFANTSDLEPSFLNLRNLGAQLKQFYSNKEEGSSEYDIEDFKSFVKPAIIENLENRNNEAPVEEVKNAEKSDDVEHVNSNYDEIYNNKWRSSLYNHVRKCDLSVLEIVFKQFISAIDYSKPGLDLSKCCFYQTDSFNWLDNPERVFHAYREVCTQYGLTPLKFNSYRPLDKVPYIRYDLLERMHRDVVKSFLHLRENDICACGKLPLMPKDEEIIDFIETDIHDDNVIAYFIAFIEFLVELEGILIQMSHLSLLYESLKIEKTAGNGQISWSKRCNAKIEFDKILGDYVRRLKSVYAIPAVWSYNIDKLIALI